MSVVAELSLGVKPVGGGLCPILKEPFADAGVDAPAPNTGCSFATSMFDHPLFHTPHHRWESVLLVTMYAVYILIMK